MEGRSIEMFIEDVHTGEREEVMAHAPEEVRAEEWGVAFWDAVGRGFASHSLEEFGNK